jgi:hypothetical protein
MIKKAYLYNSQIMSHMSDASLDPKNKYYFEWYWKLNIEIIDDEFNEQSFVSVDNYDNIIGFFHFRINRGLHCINDLSIIKFDHNPNYNIMFAKDLKRFFDLLFNFYNYTKICFNICAGSPYEEMYDKFCINYGGRIVGILTKDFLTIDKTAHDKKLYEIFRDDYLKSIKLRENA